MDPEAHLKKFQKELSTGTVALVLLAVLARSDRSLYGYQIAKQLEQRGAGAIAGKQSAIYPVLRNLEAGGLLNSEIEPSVAGPPRRYYRINANGRAVLAQWTETWNETRSFVDAVLKETAP